ncbi:MAG: hypothetical protein ACYDA9_17780 [Terriglobia bacterium]
MKNAHQRFGALQFTKRMKDTTTDIRLRLDRFIGEPATDERDPGKAHVISVVGGDQDVAAVWAAVIEGGFFTVSGPGLESMWLTLGEGAECFRGSLNLPGRKRPVRHLVAISAELAKTRPGADPECRRTVLCDDDPTFVLHRVAQRFGLPVVPEWAGWFKEELTRRQTIRPLVGVACSPVLVLGTKKTFLKWIGNALKREQIRFPYNNGPLTWTISKNFLRVVASEAVEEGGPWPPDLANQAASDKPARKFRLEDYP